MQPSSLKKLMGSSLNRGIYFALVAAIVSGFAIFISSFATKVIKEPFVLTTARNVIVAIWFSALLLGLSQWLSLKKLTIKQWGQLFLIGLIGGSIPFLLFFKGLSLSTAAGGAFIHKTLFIWVGILALIFLKEKLGLWQFLALAILLIGNYFLSPPKSWVFDQGELLVFIATLFWAAETIIAKIVLYQLPAVIVGWGRMFFGSLIMLIFLAVTNRLPVFSTFNLVQWTWIVFPSLLLFAYVGFWYSGLKYAPASLVTSILVLGFPITTLLSILQTPKYSLNQIFGSLVIVLGVAVFAYFALKTKPAPKLKWTV